MEFAVLGCMVLRYDVLGVSLFGFFLVDAATAGIDALSRHVSYPAVLC